MLPDDFPVGLRSSATQYVPEAFGEASMHLRLMRTGNVFTAFVKRHLDDPTWLFVSQTTVTLLGEVSIGMFAAQCDEAAPLSTTVSFEKFIEPQGGVHRGETQVREDGTCLHMGLRFPSTSVHSHFASFGC